MKIIYLLPILIFVMNSLGISQVQFNESYDPEDWPTHIVKFSNEGVLKDIFDSGIRPYRFPSLEKTILEFKHVKLIFETKTGQRLPSVNVMLGGIRPLENGLLSSVELTSPKLSVVEAEAIMTQFLAKGKRTREELEKYLASAAENPRDYDDLYRDDPSGFGIGWDDSGGPRYSVFFRPTFDPKTPVSFVMHVSWRGKYRTPLQQRSFYDIPIPPPPGYEDVSMEAPRNFGPDSAVEIARSKGLPITGDRTPEEYEKQWREANGKTSAPTPKAPAVAPKPKSTDSSKMWIGLAVLIVGALGLLWVLLKKRK